MKGFLKTYRIDGKNNHDFIIFLNNIKQSVIDTINNQEKPIKLKLILTCEFVKKNIKMKEEEFNFGYFQTKTELITESTDLNELFNIAIGRFSEQISKFTNKGSGWVFNKVEYFDIHFDPTNPLKGSSYFPLPKSLSGKRAIINVKNENDNECFKWAVTCAVFPQDIHPERLNKKMIENSKKFDWTGIEFPVSLKQIDKFEKQNSFAINIFGYEQNVYSLRISKKENVPIIRLLLLSEGDNKHYCWIKSFSRLCSSYNNKNKNKLYFCDRCINSFRSEDSLKKHLEYCSAHDSVKIELPPKGTKISFNNFNKGMRHPAVFYAF